MCNPLICGGGGVLSSSSYASTAALSGTETDHHHRRRRWFSAVLVEKKEGEGCSGPKQCHALQTLHCLHSQCVVVGTYTHTVSQRGEQK